jgi:membrane protease YdiL (CAAX protease family)
LREFLVRLWKGDPSPQAEDDILVEPIRPKTWRIWGVSFDARIVQIVVVGTLLLVVVFNNRFVQAEYDRFVLCLVVPLAIIVLAWREDPRRFGLRLGDWRLGLTITVAGMIVMAPIIWYTGQMADFREYYTQVGDQRMTLRLVVDLAIDLIAWEFFFRGWLLWGLARKYGSDAVWLQIVPFALMHVWKPELEQISTIIGGAFFGILAWRTRSILYCWLLHWFMMACIVIVAAGYI